METPQHGTWRKSTYSNPGNDCVEVAPHSSHVLVRDSKNRLDGSLAVIRRDWAVFIAAVGEAKIHHRN